MRKALPRSTERGRAAGVDRSYWPAVARDPKAAPLDREWARKLDAKDKFVLSTSRRDYP